MSRPPPPNDISIIAHHRQSALVFLVTPLGFLDSPDHFFDWDKPARPGRVSVREYLSLIIYPSNPRRPGLSPPPALGGFFMTTKPQRSKCRTIRSAAIRAVNVSESCMRFRPLKQSANAMLSARSPELGRRELVIGHGRTIARR